ncbi:MAG: DUF1460 domain-containing protein [Deltaproteobacteria bacterium]|nr:DUF1460 domain-containing protein [Deltaproteobacteria bacterium]
MARVKAISKETAKPRKKRTVKAAVKSVRTVARKAAMSAVQSAVKTATRREMSGQRAVASKLRLYRAPRPAGREMSGQRALPRPAAQSHHLHHRYNDRWVAFAWIVPVMAIAICGSLVMKSRVTHPVAHTSARLVSYFEQVQSRPLGDRIAFWSESLMKNPALLSVMGRGPTVDDTAPVFPTAYDCTTYVETVGALARSENGEVLADRVIAIRYHDAKPGFDTRNHFPEADWIPNNEAAGILKDVTVSIARQAGFVVSFVNKDIDKIAWFKARGMASRVLATEAEGKGKGTVTVRLPYVPIDRMVEALKHVQQGSVINIVRASRDRYPVLISHQGLLIWKDGVPYFRHASRTSQIREIPFAEYILSLRTMPWKVLGFNVNTFEG